MPNPAALALALLLGHEARITDEQWKDVMAMALDRVCPHCDGEKVKFGETCWWCDGMGRVVQPDIVLTPIPSPTPPQITHFCPACEAAARERDAMHKGWSEATLRECKLSDELTDLRARFTAAINELRGMAAVMRAQSYLPKTAAAIDERVAELTGAEFQPDDLRARLEALCVEMETDDRAGKLTHWTGAIRAELRKEVK